MLHLFERNAFSSTAARVAAGRCEDHYVETLEDLMMLDEAQLTRMFPEVGLYNRVRGLIQNLRKKAEFFSHPPRDLLAQSNQALLHKNEALIPETQTSSPSPSPDHSDSFVEDPMAIGNSVTTTLKEKNNAGRVFFKPEEAADLIKQVHEAFRHKKKKRMKPIPEGQRKWLGYDRAVKVIKTVSFQKYAEAEVNGPLFTPQ